MVETITATYLHDDEDWTITVNGRGKELSAKAPGIIAARDRADQLVDQLAPDGRPTVVHLLNGSALEFTSTYMTARLTLPEIEPLQVPPAGTKSTASAAVSAGDAPAGSAVGDPASTGATSAGSGAASASSGSAGSVSAGSVSAATPVAPAPSSAGTAATPADGPANADATAGSVSVPGQASASATPKSAKPQLPASKQLSKEVDDRKPEAPSRPGVPAGASAKPPVTRA